MLYNDTRNVGDQTASYVIYSIKGYLTGLIKSNTKKSIKMQFIDN